MKAYLMYADRDFDLGQSPSPNAPDLIKDLELPTLFAAMSAGDKWLTEVVEKAVLSGSTDLATIRYRQDILRDCLRHEVVVREIYDIAVQTIEKERKDFWGYGLRSPNSLLHRSVQVLEMLVGMLRQLRAIAERHAPSFASSGFRNLFRMLSRELDDDYLARVRQQLKLLKFQHGVLISAALGDGNKAINHVLRKENEAPGGWLSRMFTPSLPGYSFQLAPRDDNGARSLSELRERGINLVANALTQSIDHVLSFFAMLRTELAFYVGCLNLQSEITKLGGTSCFPEPVELGQQACSTIGLYDIALALTKGMTVVGNDLSADERCLVIITGANQGGKSTFLRSVGQSQLMMQCGMFVAASTYRADVRAQIFTHFKREEEAEMNSGKFDEELSRMSRIVDQLQEHCLVLFNESFAATNEREGSEIARQIVTALIEGGTKVFFVSHQFAFASGFHDKKLSAHLFLRAERQSGGSRTFKVIEGAPLQTSHGEDLYRRIFGDAAAA